ncbi:hypothetical protein MAR_037289 [Mya arenaria]|uniref:Uncharacterized protein n=1 Tax=Mya arenaria TaxID=6604 RepID=A0ABY7FN20_MYAAR|nr:hypothetical protein MAR_037289 [Mya arenaria]
MCEEEDAFMAIRGFWMVPAQGFGYLITEPPTVNETIEVVGVDLAEDGTVELLLADDSLFSVAMELLLQKKILQNTYSEKQITKKSGLVDMCEEEDTFMANKRFFNLRFDNTQRCKTNNTTLKEEGKAVFTSSQN